MCHDSLPGSRADRVAERFESGPSHAIVAVLTPTKASREIKYVAVESAVDPLEFPDGVETHRDPRIPEAT